MATAAQQVERDFDPATGVTTLRMGEPLSDPYANPHPSDDGNGAIGRPPKYVLTDEIRAALRADFDGRRSTNEDIGQRFGVPSWKIGEWARELRLSNKIQPRYATGKVKASASADAGREADTPTQSGQSGAPEGRETPAPPLLVRTPLPVIMDDDPPVAPDYRMLHDLLDLLPADGVWASMDRREHWLTAFRALIWILTELPERTGGAK